jgi:hypothetical protein
MSPSPAGPRVARPSAALLVVLAVLVVAALAGCGFVSTTPPAPTPADFQGIAGEIVRRGVVIERIVSGDPGCTDAELARTAIRFEASGLGQTEPATVYLYIFRNRDAYERLRSRIDACARSYVDDPETFESVETSPFVLAGQGPWADDLAAALREALVTAAGTGD